MKQVADSQYCVKQSARGVQMRWWAYFFVCIGAYVKILSIGAYVIALVKYTPIKWKIGMKLRVLREQLEN